MSQALPLLFKLLGVLPQQKHGEKHDRQYFVLACVALFLPQNVFFWTAQLVYLVFARGCLFSTFSFCQPRNEAQKKSTIFFKLYALF